MADDELAAAITGMGTARAVPHGWLGPSVDDAARDGLVSLRVRGGIAGVTSLVVAANVGSSIAACWATIYLITEAWGWQSSRRPAAGLPGTAATRLSYLGAVGAMTLNWSAIAFLYWFEGGVALKIAAVIGIVAQLIHAQAFTFRSPPVLVVNAVIPAATLLILPVGFGGYSGISLLTILMAWAMSVLYVVASAHGNMVAADRLRSAQTELEKLAYLDSLTLLGNRRRFVENLRRRIEFSSDHGTRFALLFVDLDRFKQVNDTLGHAAGDTLLIEVGQRLRRAVGEADDIARTGGDEFAVLLAAAADPAGIEATCQRICDSFIQAVDCGGVPVATSVSIGVAHFPDDGARIDSLVHSADRALYASKAGGRGTWRLATAELGL